MSPRVVIATHRLSIWPADGIVINPRTMTLSRGRLVFYVGKSGPSKGQMTLRLLSAVLLRVGTVLEWTDLIEHLWGDDLEGGPLQPKQHIWLALRRQRALIDTLGVKVSSSWSFGVLCEWAEPSQVRDCA